MKSILRQLAKYNNTSEKDAGATSGIIVLTNQGGKDYKQILEQLCDISDTDWRKKYYQRKHFCSR